MAAAPLNVLMQVWGAQHPESLPPFSSKEHLHEVIDSTEIGGVPWQSFTATYGGEVVDCDLECAPWKLKGHNIWFRDPLQVLHSQLGNPDFNGEMDLAAKHIYDSKGKQQYGDVLSGEWAHRQS
ncbi:hypothetical protein C0992_011678, partial [Termitomyces sp. T32_za158]